MDSISKKHSKPTTVNSPIGKTDIDSSGSPISVVRLDAFRAYVAIPILLQKYINNNDSWAWAEITNKIDYIYSYINNMLIHLDKETNCFNKIKSDVASGKKLLFKPNILAPNVINKVTHGEDVGAISCTEWAFVAALMRWFHDKLDISYYKMCLAEASATSFVEATTHARVLGKPFTTESIIEGRNGDLYGGWGFYFVRKYLSDHHPNCHSDNPMNGYRESINGTFVPPGKAKELLMVYDLNKLSEDVTRGRTVKVPDGANFKEITLHKAIIGGDPSDSTDMDNYPGCVLINLPKLKMHAQDMLTNSIKNIGIGLYPSQSPSDPNHSSWKYALPSNTNPNMKGKLPHSPWVMEIDEITRLPKKDSTDNYILKKTEGFSGTQSDVIKAVQSQNVFMLHVSDGINIINVSHDPIFPGVRIEEGFIFSSLDCVALDVFCANYCFNMLPMEDSLKLKKTNNWSTEFVQKVPIAEVNGPNIVTKEDYDSPLFRYDLYRYAESRGIGSQNYYVIGWDGKTDCPFASLLGHLGVISNSQFNEVITNNLYYNQLNFLYSLQKTVLTYAKSSDKLTGSSYYKELMNLFDENNDGVISYDEKGRGIETARFSMMSYTKNIEASEKYGQLMSAVITFVYNAKYSDKKYNSQNHDFAKEMGLANKATVAYVLSNSQNISEDIFIKGMSYGKGNWPSYKTADHIASINGLFGSLTLKDITLNSPYGCLFQYADKVFNNGLYTGSTDANKSDPDSLNNYFKAISNGTKPLDFVFYVPVGIGTLENTKVVNVEETTDPNKIYTVNFKWFYDAFAMKPSVETKMIRENSTNLQGLFELDPNKVYRMPVYFGGSDFVPNSPASSTDIIGLSLTMATDASALIKYIPKEFTLLKPEITLGFKQFRGSNFLNGGGYNAVQLIVPVRFNGKQDVLEGVLPLVIWENKAQPIIGGREDSGMPKIFCDIEDLSIILGIHHTTLSYEGNTFLEIEVRDTKPQPVEVSHSDFNVFGLRYISKIGSGGSDLCQYTLYPQSFDTTYLWSGTGSVKWTKLGVEKHLFHAHIIDALADIPIYSIVAQVDKGSSSLNPSLGRVIK